MNNILDCQDSVRVCIKHIEIFCCDFWIFMHQIYKFIFCNFPIAVRVYIWYNLLSLFFACFSSFTKTKLMLITINMQWDLYRMKMPSLKLPPPWPMGLSFGSGCISFISLYVISWGFVSNSLIISRLSISPSLSRSILLKISWYLSWFTGDSELCLNVQ